MDAEESDASSVLRKLSFLKRRVINMITDIGDEGMKRDAESVISNSSLPWWETVNVFLHHFDSSITHSGVCSTTTVSECSDGNTSTITNNIMDPLITIIPTILKEWASYALLVGVLYWLFKYYIPARDAFYERNMQQMQETFKQAMHDVTVNIGGEIKELKTEVEKIKGR